MTNIYVLTGNWSSDNYQLEQHSQRCCIIQIDETKLLHQKLGHINFLSLHRLVKTGVVTGNSKNEDAKGISIGEALKDFKQENSCRDVQSSVDTSSYTPSGDVLDVVITSDSKRESNKFDIFKNIRKDSPSEIQKNHPWSQIMGDVTDRVRIRKKNLVNYQDMIK